MKKLLLPLLPVLWVLNAQAQIQLEHTYPKGKLARLNLDQSGEHYALQFQDNPNGASVTVYHADHTSTGIVFQAFPPFSGNTMGAYVLS
ncbi:MAG: hypothetical protein SFV22_00155, partial [Saprospiraceae bacterium]|nr:hypothetical protein [Saprospiraceae bacterium]